MRSLPLLLSIAALVVACTKSEGTDTGSSPSASSVPPPAASSAAAASASAATTASAAPSGTASATAATASATAGAATGGAPDGGKVAAAASGSAGGGANMSGAGECGTKPLPDCPLQGWMKVNMNPPSIAGDTAKLGEALDKAAGYGPAGYANWKSIANDGAKAAKGGDLAAAKASCRSCHDQYKKKYQAELRTRKI